MSERMPHLNATAGAGLARLATPAIRWVALLMLCAAYLQGGLTKALNFPIAIEEMKHFGMAPAGPMAVLVIALELGASAMILTGIGRWLGALALASFTLMASFMANAFWNVPMPDRIMVENGFFEHIGLVGGFVLVAWHDVRRFGPMGSEKGD